MSRYASENFRPTQADVELLAISVKTGAGDAPVQEQTGGSVSETVSQY